MTKKYVWLLTAALVVVGCSEKKEQKVKAPTRVTTEVITAATADNGRTYVGIVEEQEATAVSFTSMGVVKRILVDEGQQVKKGQLIAEIDNSQALNMVKSSEAQLTQAEDALQRYSMLHENGSLPEVQWVEIQSKVAQARVQLEVAKKNLADCRLVAPVSGVIGKRQISVGETALPSQAVVSILDISKVKVRVAIPEAEIGSISSNTPTTVRVEAIGASFEGGLIEKGVQADAMTHTYDIKINVENSDRRLMPGMVAEVETKQQTLETLPQPLPGREGSIYSLPVTCVQKKGDGGLFVWVVDDSSKVHRVGVSTGETIGNRVMVTTGLEEGQRVVTEGYQKLSENTQVIY